MATDPKKTAPPEEPPTAAPAGIPSQDPRLKAQEPLTPSERASEANSVVMGGGMMAGAAAGPLVGGLLLEHYWWGSVFLVNLPIMALVLTAGPVLIPESRGDAAKKIDVRSSLLSITAIVPIVYAVKHWVGSGWDAGVPVAALVGIVSGWLFIRRQRKLPHPLLDITLFRVPAFTGAVASNGLAIFAFIGLLYFYSQYLQLVREFSPLQAGVAELPGTLASIAVIAVVGAVSTRFGAGRAIGFGLAIGALGLTGIGVSVFHADYWPLALALVVIGFGIGIAMTLSTDAVVSAVPKERAGAASAIAETAYELGTALGIAALGSLHFLMYRSHLDLPAETAANDAVTANASLAETITTVADPVVVEHARDAFATAVQTTSFTAAGLLVLAAVAAWRMIPSDRPGLRKESHGGH